MTNRTMVFVFGGLLATTFISACGGDDGLTSEGISLPTITLDASSRFASIETEGDIADWGSYILRIRVSAETPVDYSKLSPGEEITREYTMGRELRVSVEDVLWAHPERVSKVAHGESLNIYTYPGFAVKDGTTYPAAEPGDIRMDVSQSYVVVMADDVAADGRQILALLGVLKDESGAAVLPDGSALRVNAVNDHLKKTATVPPPRPGQSLIDRLDELGTG